ncbi:MAG: hypothetical protein JWO30_3412 [Fibrobacteres bacterium]|nr:hypothetical protein [Fibrobacterota bacterium]
MVRAWERTCRSPDVRHPQSALRFHPGLPGHASGLRLIRACGRPPPRDPARCSGEIQKPRGQPGRRSPCKADTAQPDRVETKTGIDRGRFSSGLRVPTANPTATLQPRTGPLHLHPALTPRPPKSTPQPHRAPIAPSGLSRVGTKARASKVIDPTSPRTVRPADCAAWVTTAPPPKSSSNPKRARSAPRTVPPRLPDKQGTCRPGGPNDPAQSSQAAYAPLSRKHGDVYADNRPHRRRYKGRPGSSGLLVTRYTTARSRGSGVPGPIRRNRKESPRSPDRGLRGRTARAQASACETPLARAAHRERSAED